MIPRPAGADRQLDRGSECVWLEELRRSGVLVRLVEHEPASTVQESQALAHRPPGMHLKTLVLRDRAGQLYLLSVREDRRVSMNEVRRDLGAKGSLSLLSADQVTERLGVPPGGISPLSVLGANPGSISIIIDEEVLSAHLTNCAFMSNAVTAIVRPHKLFAFLKERGFDPVVYRPKER